MAWSDEPSPNQIGAWENLVHWRLDEPTIALAVDFIKRTKTRREMSDELGRARQLYIQHKLTSQNVWEGEFWEGFEHD